jgi:hypothetical protein
MALTAAQRLALRATYGATLSDRREAFNISKANLDNPPALRLRLHRRRSCSIS